MSSRKSTFNQLFILIIVMASALCPEALSATELSPFSKTYVPRLEKMLHENIVVFWHPRCLDKTNGGYIINFDSKGQPTLGPTKMIVTQARTIWLFARLARAGYEPERHLEAAELGYRFLREKMWDKENRGFYWEVDVTGDKVLRLKKHLYG